MEISAKTALTGLIGFPVEHSISPQMSNTAFDALGLDWVYLAFDIRPDDLAAAVRGLKSIGIRGFNVTMPYKIRIMDFMDELTPAARLAGACNTVIIKNGRMTGHTTDGIGFMRSVKEAGHDIIGKKMSILGAGGAACAIISQAALDGVSEIDIFRRNRHGAFEETAAFAKRVRESTDCLVHVYDFAHVAQLGKSLTESAILVNATNIGMSPKKGDCPIPDASLLAEGLIVYDIIYDPRKTALCRMAEEAGCPAYNGLGMLLFQGAASFECWTGVEMPIEPVKNKVFTP